MAVADEVAGSGFAAGAPLALAVTGDGAAVAWPAPDGPRTAALRGGVEAELPALDRLDPRWVWWSVRDVTAVVPEPLRPRACWDLAVVHRLIAGGSRDDPAAVWAGAHDLPAPPPPRGEPDLLDLDPYDDVLVRPDGQLGRDWARGGWRADLDRAARWAAAALDVQQRQEARLRALSDPRGRPTPASLAVLTAHAESTAAVLAVELERAGLPLDRATLAELLTAAVGPPPADERAAAAQRRRRDDEVRALFPSGSDVDLRNPAQVRAMLARVGLDLPDTRSWRLEPHAATSPPVAALLAWRKAERLATTYGWAWLDRHVGADGRLRGGWSPAEGAGRMSASAGLHNLPGELRPAVRAEPGHVFVRADLGQVEPRVLAVVAADPALAAAAREDDMYAAVASALRCDRPTAKVAMLAAMYGQTSGTAGAALRDMDRAYPVAMAYLRRAEQAGRDGDDLRTHGGRLLRLARPAGDDRYPPSAWGRFARNAVVQGAAAELFKAWAATVRAGLRGPDDGRAGEIVLCLHDELLLHVPADTAAAAADLVTAALRSVAGWWAAGSGVRFVAEVSVADTWAAAH